MASEQSVPLSGHENCGFSQNHSFGHEDSSSPLARVTFRKSSSLK